MKKVTSSAVLFAFMSCITAQESDYLKQIEVISSKQDKVLSDVDSYISIITDDDIEKYQAQNIQDVFRYEPGVNFDGAGRFGIDDIRIRGVSENRVQIRLDGMPMPESFAFGPFLSSGRQYFDISDLKQVEIVRGSDSVLYGSSAIGGVVNFISKDPEDYLADDKPYGGEARAGYYGDNKGFMLGATGAYAITDNVKTMLSYTHRDYDEKETHGGQGGTGTEREKANPQDAISDNLLSKWVFEPNGDNRFTLTGQYYHQNVSTDIYSNYGQIGRDGTLLNSQQADDNKQRTAVQLKHDFKIDSALTDGGYWYAYYQDSNTNQKTIENETILANRQQSISYRNSEYSSQNYGMEAQFDKYLTLGSQDHHITYGFNYSHEEVDMQRSGFDRNISTDTTSGIFREKNFPDSTIKEMDVFVQDTISLFDDKLEIVPGLGYHKYKLDTSDGLVYSETSGGIAPTDFNENEFTARLGLLYRLNNTHSIFANYNQGFRAPAFDDANVGFANYSQGYSAVPNPGLKPEKSDTYELGLRSQGELGYSSVSAFYTKYDDFIDNLGNTRFNPQTGLIEFQSINLDEAEIYGAEFAGMLKLNEVFNFIPKGFSLRASIAYAKGQDTKTDDPITTVEPLNGVLGIIYDAPSQLWSVEAVGRFAKGKNNSDISDASLETGITGTGGYAVYDLLGRYNFAKSGSLDMGIYNLFDREYTQWGEAMLTAGGSGRNRVTEPGRYVAATVNYKF